MSAYTVRPAVEHTYPLPLSEAFRPTWEAVRAAVAENPTATLITLQVPYYNGFQSSRHADQDTFCTEHTIDGVYCIPIDPAKQAEPFVLYSPTV